MHPVIIWSQDSDHNAVYLILTIFVWFLPLMVHLLIKFILTNIIDRRYAGIGRTTPGGGTEATNSMAELVPLNTGGCSSSGQMGRKQQRRSAYASKTSLLSTKKSEAVMMTSSSPAAASPAAAGRSAASANSGHISRRLVNLIDVGMQVVQLAIFLVAFSFVTDYIIHTELDSSKANLKQFVLPAIVSVFFWMMSISYFLLDLTMNATKESVPLVFKDKEEDEATMAARNELRQSLRRRLELLDKRRTIGALPPRQHRQPLRPLRPPPPPPTRPKPSLEIDSFKNSQKEKVRPPVPPKPERLLAASVGSQHSNRPPPPPIAPKPKLVGRFVPVAEEEDKTENQDVPVGDMLAQRNNMLRSRSLPPGSRRVAYVPVLRNQKPQQRQSFRGVMDSVDLAASSDSLVIQIREAALEADSLGGGGCREDPAVSPAGTVVNQDRRMPADSIAENIKMVAEEDDDGLEPSRTAPGVGHCARALNYLLERQEYAFPELHGWRIRFRRIFLHLGVLGFSYTTYQTIQVRPKSGKMEMRHR